MHFKFARQRNLLIVDDFFAHLVDINRDGDINFEFSYSISQLEAFRSQALIVDVMLYSQTLSREKVTTGVVSRGRVDTKLLIKKSLKQVTNAKSVKKQQELYVLARRRSDITAHVNNEIVTKLMNGVPASSIPSLHKRKIVLANTDDLKRTNDDRPILTLSSHASFENVNTATSASLDFDPTNHMLKMISEGVDPSSVTGMTHRSVSAIDSIGGTLRRNRSNDVDSSSRSQLLNYYVFSPDNLRRETTTDSLQANQFVHVVDSVVDDTLKISVPIQITHASRRLPNQQLISSIQVEFRLINARSGEVVDTITRPLDLERHVNFFYTPKKSPNVSVGRADVVSRVNLEIRQVDAIANSVNVYRKKVSRSETIVDEYSSIGTYNIDDGNKPLTLSVDCPSNSPVIYHVVPIGPTGIPGFDFTSVVIKPTRPSQKNSFSLDLEPQENGVKICVSQLPTNIVSLQVVVKNVSTNQRDFSNVSTPFLIDETVRLSGISFVDQDAVDDRVYQYAVRLTYKSGTSEIMGSRVIHYVRVQPGRISTLLSNVQVTNDGNLDVRFTINSQLVDTSNDIVKSLLDRDDITRFFGDELKAEREFLSGLLAHNVQRVDLVTGDRDDFGVLTNNEFSDRTLAEKNAVQPLIPGRRYRYEVYALLRSPETLFETLRKSRIDPTTRKPYVFSPAKFLHPFALKNGTIVSDRGLKTRYGQDQMFHGTMGLTQKLDVSFDADAASVIDVSASRFARNTNQLFWRVQGMITSVDHFLIMKEVNGVRTIVGKTHSEFKYNSCQYYHTLTERDIGELRYVIIPIFNDYTVGKSVISNAIKVDDI